MLLFFAFLILGIPIGLTFFGYRYLRYEYPDNKYYKYFAFIPTLILIYFIWSAIYPSDDFYKVDYKEVTQMEFPANGKIKYKSASYPDHFGDYTSVFVIETSKEEIDQLKRQLVKLNFQGIHRDTWSDADTKTALKKTDAKLTEQYFYDSESSKNYYVGFFDDDQTVLIRRLSW